MRFLQIKASRVTTSNSGNFRVICNISPTNFIPSASSHIIRHSLSIDSVNTRLFGLDWSGVSTAYILPTPGCPRSAKQRTNVPQDLGAAARQAGNPTSYNIRHQIYIIHIKSSYQIPPDQGFQGHYFKLRELQRTMQHFSYKFRSFRFQSN